MPLFLLWIAIFVVSIAILVKSTDYLIEGAEGLCRTASHVPKVQAQAKARVGPFAASQFDHGISADGFQ